MKTQEYRKIIISNIVLIAMTFVIGITHQQCASSTAQTEANNDQPVIPVKIANEQLRQLAKTIETSGLIVASTDHRLSFKTGGIINQILVKEGQTVKKGQLLATLKPDEIDAQVRQANLGLEKATRDYDRIKNLYNDSVATLEQFQNVTTALELAKSTVKIAEYNRQFSKIESPVSGVVLAKLNARNEMVGPGQPVLVIASKEEQWQIKTALSDKDIVKVSLTDSATVTLDAFPGQQLNASVIQIGDAPDPMTGLYEVRLSLIQQNLQLKPGFFSDLIIQPHKKNTYVTIPIEAVAEGIGNTVTYYSLNADQTKAVKKTANIAWLQDNYVVLDTENHETETVIVESQKELSHLALVEVTENDI